MSIFITKNVYSNKKTLSKKIKNTLSQDKQGFLSMLLNKIRRKK